MSCSFAIDTAFAIAFSLSDAEISVFGKIINIHSMLIGEYNLENILGAVSLVMIVISESSVEA
mgnify:CR=1 FL=1